MEPPPAFSNIDCSYREHQARVVVIQGIFDPTGERLLELKPVCWYATSITSPKTSQPSGRFSAEITSATGAVVTRPFNARVADDSFPGITQHGFFEVSVPVSGTIVSIFITDATRTKVFAHIDVQAGLSAPGDAGSGVGEWQIEEK